jgi:hypothetical protein
MHSEKPLSSRQCVICSSVLVGRSDKRFCDIKCRNYYHAEVRRSVKSVVSETMKILKHNYVQLTGMLGEKDSCVVDRLALERKGFRFNYVTDAELLGGIIYYSLFGIRYRLYKKRVYISVDSNRKPVSPFIFERWNREYAETKTGIAEQLRI